MKNSYLLLVIGLLLIAILPGCKKGTKTCKLGKYYNSDGNSTPAPNVFAYYADGKLKSIVHTNGTKDTVSYNADSISVLSYDHNDSLVSVFTGLLNANGAVTSAVKTTYDYSGNITGTDNMAFEYDANGRLTKQTTNNNIVLALNYTDGNSTTGSLHTGGVINKRYYFFHNTAANKTRVDDLNGVLSPWLGTPSANLLDSTYIVLPTTSDTIRVQYYHTLDDNEYVSKTVETWFNPGPATRYNTYQYFDCE